jgi:hypothetical protein
VLQVTYQPSALQENLGRAGKSGTACVQSRFYLIDARPAEPSPQ